MPLAPMKSATPHLLAIGNALADIITPVEEAFIARHCLDKGSLTLVQQLPALPDAQTAAPPTCTAGGSAANLAVAFASLGGTAAFAGRVGTDAEGESFARSLSEAGVQPLLAQDKARPTGACLCLVTPDAQRTLITRLAAAAHLKATDLPRPLPGCPLLLLEGHLWAGPHGTALLKALHAGRAGNARIALTAPDAATAARQSRRLHAALERCHILFANAEEACALYRTRTHAQAVAKAVGKPYTAVLTKHEHGAVIVHKGEIHQVEAIPVQAVDTTGAGDAFAAGFLYGLASGLAPQNAGRLGCLAASRIVTHYGARPRQTLRHLPSLVAANPSPD